MLIAYFLSYSASQFVIRRGKKRDLDSYDFILLLGIPLSVGSYAYVGFTLLMKDKSNIELYALPQLIIEILGQWLFCLAAYVVQKTGKCTGYSLLHFLHLVPTIMITLYHPGCEKITIYCCWYLQMNVSLF